MHRRARSRQSLFQSFAIPIKGDVGHMSMYIMRVTGHAGHAIRTLSPGFRGSPLTHGYKTDPIMIHKRVTGHAHVLFFV